jgi:hypothetical protein
MATIKPETLKNYKDPAKLQAIMKADLKKSAGKTGLKFVAAKNFTVGTRKISLFLLTDNPAVMDIAIKQLDPKAYRAKGTADVAKDKTSGAFQVTIRSATGQITPEAVAELVRPAVASEKSIVATVAKGTDKITDAPQLKHVTSKVSGEGVDDQTKEAFKRDRLQKANLRDEIAQGTKLKSTTTKVSEVVTDQTKEEYKRDKPLKEATRQQQKSVNEQIVQGTKLKPTTTKVVKGVDEGVKEEYRREAKQTLIASMTSDGKIGSVYFKDGRIRTTHGAGPEKEGHDGERTVQFNIDDRMAQRYYLNQGKQLKTQKDWDAFDQWLALALNNTPINNLPDWVKLIKGPEDAHDLGTGAPGKLTLFEIFKDINGDVEGWHPSRGTATKFETDKQTIAVLQAAIKYIDGQGTPKIDKVTDPGERNVKFYEFVSKRLPKFVPFMRKPTEV